MPKKVLESRVTFIDGVPGSTRSIKYDWATILRDFRENPGTWAVVGGENTANNPGAAQAVARNMRLGRVSDIKPGEFEATTRGTVVYARYVGNESTNSAE